MLNHGIFKYLFNWIWSPSNPFIYANKQTGVQRSGYLWKITDGVCIRNCLPFPSVMLILVHHADWQNLDFICISIFYRSYVTNDSLP